MLSTAAIAWLPWRAGSFARARAEGKPVLLSLGPTWCRHTAAMDSTTFADADVAAVVNAQFVAIRVDADRRPDIAARYDLGGWPTTAFLTPEGGVLGGGTYVDPRRLAELLPRVSAAFSRAPRPGAPPASPVPGREDRTVATLEQLTGQVIAVFDPDNGGFGAAPKFPHAAPVRLALAL